MNRRHFWQMPEGLKFRTIFEDAETVMGINERNEQRLFRKDTGKITFTETEALENSLTSLIKKNFKNLKPERRRKLKLVCA
jgi:hypothetical protein